MASDLRVRVGGVTAMISLNGASGQLSDAQVGAAIERFMLELGIPITGTNVENLTAYLKHVKDDTARVAKRRHRREQEAERAAEITATVDSENNL